MNDNKNSMTNKVGQIIGTIIFAALALCALAIIVTLTAKFILWLI